MNTVKGDMRTVACLDDSLQFISDSQDVEPIREHIGTDSDGYDSFFVRVQDGDYAEVWGMCGIVPRLSKLVSRLV